MKNSNRSHAVGLWVKYLSCFNWRIRASTLTLERNKDEILPSSRGEKQWRWSPGWMLPCPAFFSTVYLCLPYMLLPHFLPDFPLCKEGKHNITLALALCVFALLLGRRQPAVLHEGAPRRFGIGVEILGPADFSLIRVFFFFLSGCYVLEIFVSLQWRNWKVTCVLVCTYWFKQWGRSQAGQYGGKGDKRGDGIS